MMGRVGLGDADQLAQLVGEALKVRALSPAGRGPAADEVVNRGVGGSGPHPCNLGKQGGVVKAKQTAEPIADDRAVKCMRVRRRSQLELDGRGGQHHTNFLGVSLDFNVSFDDRALDEGS